MRFPNGIQIYYVRLPLSVTGWIDWSDVSMSNSLINHTYTAPFISPPALVTFAEAVSSNSTMSVMQFDYNLPSATQTGDLRILRPSGGGNGTYYINIIAIGRWK